MKDDFNYIDELVKGSLEGLEEEAGNQVWEKLRWTLFWMKYRWYIGLSSLLLLISVSALVGFNGSLRSNSRPDGFSNIDQNSKVLLAFNQQVESHAMYDDQMSNNPENNIDSPLGSDGNVADELQPSIVVEEIISADDFMSAFEEISNESANVSSYQRSVFSLSGMKVQLNDVNLAMEPDSGLIGYHVRTDIKTLEVDQHWFSVSIYVGPSFPSSHVSGMTSEYVDLRKANETNAMGWSLGSDIRFHLKHWVLTTGLNFSVYNQDRFYSKQYQEYAAEDSYFDYDTTWVYVYDAPDYGVPMITGIDSTWVNVYRDVTLDQSGKNQVKYIEIPLMLGYGVNSNRFSVELNAGLSMGFLMYSNVLVPSLTDYGELQQVEQMNKTVFNLVANASLYYHLDRKTSLFVSPYYKQNMHSIFNDNYSQSQRFNTIGINFGVNILF